LNLIRMNLDDFIEWRKIITSSVGFAPPHPLTIEKMSQLSHSGRHQPQSWLDWYKSSFEEM
jgi:hypothetical protein